MTPLQSFCLYADTILIIVCALIYILKVNGKDSGQEAAAVQTAGGDERAITHMDYSAKSEGSIRLANVDEELVPVILAGISASADMPMSAFKIKSISGI